MTFVKMAKTSEMTLHQSSETQITLRMNQSKLKGKNCSWRQEIKIYSMYHATGGRQRLSSVGKHAQSCELLSFVLVGDVCSACLKLFDFVYHCRSDGRVALHPSSVNSDEKTFISQWLVYHDKVIIISIYVINIRHAHRTCEIRKQQRFGTVNAARLGCRNAR